MKQLFLSFAVIALVSFSACKNQTEEKSDTPEMVEEQIMPTTKVTFGVRGNCGMCKKNIEKAAMSIDGVTEAIWDIDRKKATIAFNEDMAHEEDIHRAIAAAGYDTERITADQSAYDELVKCCQYDREMAMNLDEPIDGEEGNHHHMD